MTSSHQDPDIDALLGRLLAPPDGPGDRKFTARIDRAIDARAAYARARSRFWQSFALETLTILALLIGLWMLSKMPLLVPFAGPGHWGLATPLLLILLLWFATQRWRQV